MVHRIIALIALVIFTTACGKIGPLNLPKDKLDKSVITYPCDEACIEKFEAEKQRQQSVIIQTD